MLPVVRENAARRVALYEALDVGPHRPVWQVLLDTVHAADVVMRDLRATLGQDGTVTLEQLDRFVVAVERASRLAKTAIDARVVEMQVRDVTTQAEMLSPLFTFLLDLLEAWAPGHIVMEARAELSRRLQALDDQDWQGQPGSIDPAGSARPAIPGSVVRVEDAA